MTDEDRIRLATLSNGTMLGPVERERCSKHRRRWVLFRWVWDEGSDPSASEPQIVRGCGTCNTEDAEKDY